MALGANGYGTTARVLHWLVAALILAMIPVGVIMVREGLDRGFQDALFIFHKNVGSLLIALVALRLVWRLTHPPAPLPAHLPGWQRRAAGLSHLALYVLMIAMPLSGYVRVRAGGFPIEALDAIGLPPLVPRSEALADAASALHQGAAWALVAVLALHVGAGLHHALILRDGVWQRIWPPRARP
ncbi:cytochrome b [Paracoccus liaowanqingii]|uniref:Cytochrome b n=2 Tax=Paracoccus liaowanqingii TaxID=2560053 RepID=A0A4Z1CAN6_9RHOB|nr:cytochrome b [Paracoccus liaowanqingii]TGN55383.1 cytochrome b [Paracoccus liaowanqingii]